MQGEVQYSRNPITEALLDIQVEPRPDLAVSSLLACREPVARDYPTKNDLGEAKGHFSLGPEAAAASTTYRETGYAFISEDGRQIFQARVDGFTTNRLAPYNRWKNFSGEARRLWNVYRRVAGPVRIKRVGVRYINRLDVPSETVDLKDYFRTYPEISPELPQHLHGFFMQVILPLPDVKAAAGISQTVAPPTQPGSVSIVFDLDVYRTEDLPANEEELWGLFEVFRSKKNGIFEACITDKTRELIR